MANRGEEFAPSVVRESKKETTTPDLTDMLNSS